MTTPEIKKQAFMYFCKGLNSKEIAKLLDLNYRTVQKIAQREKWKEQTNPTALSETIRNMRKKELSFNEIAKRLKISKSTVYRKFNTSK